ncbi:hypothetical protein [Eubacterium ramulus]|mgnify:FL=1|jgi:hypothetical protein|uniref:hypothetical protein n=1 Tax=Eubacterium ramulus TaxID=39490 RepID=UPI0035213F74
MAEKNLIKVYVNASSSKRVNLIIKNYNDFMGIVEGYTEGLRYMIECEKESGHRHDIGELGVRVQGGSIKSDPTANKAVAKIMTTEALIKCDFSGGVLKGVDRAEEFVSDAYLLRKMRNDYQLFNKQVETLGAEKDVFEKYLTGEMSLSDIAELQNISYESAQQKIHKIRSRVRRQVIGFMDGKMGGIA